MSEGNNFYELAQIVGNTMATKNRIAYNLWITKAIKILLAKLSKQNCLDSTCQERVGMITRPLKPLSLKGFGGFFATRDHNLTTESNDKIPLITLRYYLQITNRTKD